METCFKFGVLGNSEVRNNFYRTTVKKSPKLLKVVPVLLK